MKIILSAVIAAALACVFAACPNSEPSPGSEPELPESKYTIMGTVTITRNGMSWNLEDCHYIDYLAQYDLPWVSAYNEEGTYLGSTRDHYRASIIWLGEGKYQWEIDIPDTFTFPYKAYFEIYTPMIDVSGDPKKMTEGIWLTHADYHIDLGHINYEVVRLSGNLPVTVNGKAVSFYYDDRYNHEAARMSILLPDGSHLGGTEIQTNGDWVMNILAPDSEMSLSFKVMAFKNGGIFKQDINTGDHTIYDSDKEFIFPEYQSIDFKAFTLSGTIRALTPEGYQPFGDINFYDEDVSAESPPWDRYDKCFGSAEIKYLQVHGDGSAVWTAMVPVFSVPKKLYFSLDVQMVNEFYWAYSAIDIADNTNLSSIDLGVFTKWDGYAYGGL